MAKLYLNDLASVLVEKHKLSKQEASRFLTAIVEVIHDAVATDKLVKIKGLGTFKVIDVDARGSVDVNTGERIVIDGHQKLTFVPDNAMKELVNKPFSQFETVILNENVTFEEEAPVQEEEKPVEEEAPVQEEEKPVDEEVSIQEEEKPVEEKVPVQEEEKPVEEEVPVQEQLFKIVEPTEKEEEPVEVEPERKRWPLWLGLAVLACALCFGAGYFVGQKCGQAETKVAAQEETQPADTIVTQPVVVTDTIAHVHAADSLEQQPVADADLQPQQPQQLEEEDYMKYEEMDSRVRTGAYHIIGTDFVVNARPNDNTARIARRTLGAGMECYIEVYNGIDGHAVLQEGQEVKIPKLRMKENVRKRRRAQ